MAPPLVWLDMSICGSSENRQRVGVRPPLTKRRLIAAAAKVFSGVSKQAKIFLRSSGVEIKEELKSSGTEEMRVVLSLSGGLDFSWSCEQEPLEGQEEVASADADIENVDSMQFQIEPLVHSPIPTNIGVVVIRVIECLSDELLVGLSKFLSVTSSLAAGCSCRLWRAQMNACSQLWKAVCESLFGKTSLLMHELAWEETAPSRDQGNACFYRQLIKASSSCSAFVHSSVLRQRCLQTVPELSCMDDMMPLDVQKYLKHHFCASGHTAVALESLVVIIGGWRKRRSENDIHLYVIDVADKLCLKQPVLTTDSFRPSRRLRHACCVVQPSFLPASAFSQQSILMLGGCHDRTEEPLPGLNKLNFLSFTKRDGSEAQWFEIVATGKAPQSIWHHLCGTFAKGKRVVVFGGDFLETDPEFLYIHDRCLASIVYVLDVELRSWERVQTSGVHPVWRSLHAGVVHESLRDATERLVIFGGCIEHTDIFYSSDVADMRGYSLDLQSWTWLRGPGGSDVPPIQMRVSVERLGRFLLVYGGHGDANVDDAQPCNSSSGFLKLDLLTLSWGRCDIAVEASNYKAIASTTLTGGVIFGGVQVKPAGISVVPKLDFLHLDFLQNAS